MVRQEYIPGWIFPWVAFIWTKESSNNLSKVQCLKDTFSYRGDREILAGIVLRGRAAAMPAFVDRPSWDKVSLVSIAPDKFQFVRRYKIHVPMNSNLSIAIILYKNPLWRFVYSRQFSKSDARNSIAALFLNLFRLLFEYIFIFFFFVNVSVANLNHTKKVSLDYGQLLRLR